MWFLACRHVVFDTSAHVFGMSAARFTNLSLSISSTSLYLIPCEFLISSFLHVGAWLLACRLVLYMSAKDFVLPCRHVMLTMSACGRGGRGGRLYKAAALASRSTSSTSTCPRCAAKWAGVSPLLLQLGSLLTPKPLMDAKP